MKAFVSTVTLTGLLTALPLHADTMVERLGDIIQVALPLTGLAATYALDDPEGRTQLLYSFGATFATTHILKRTVQKERPNGRNSLSFPSGHTSAAFSGASFINTRYGWQAGLPAYLAASYVGYSRVYAEQHDWYDVAAGAAIAIGFNTLLVSPENNASLGISPIAGGWHVNFSLSY